MIWLIFAHFIGDWSLQPEWVAHNKGKLWFVMVAHCAVWTGIVCAFYAAFVRNDEPWTHCGMQIATLKVAFLFVGHYVCDLWKCKVDEKVPFCQQKTYWHLYVDQIWHIFQCAIVWIW